LTTTETEKEKYPIGSFIPPEETSFEDLQNQIETISEFPDKLEKLVEGLNKEQWNTCYRRNGWTIKQVVHHLADSHMNSYIRFKLALTEDIPTVKPYFEDRWAELGDNDSTDVSVSLLLLKALHVKWVNLIKSMSEEDFEKSFFHPEHGKEFTLKEILALYSWHCNHHYAQIEELLKRKGWNKINTVS